MQKPFNVWTETKLQDQHKSVVDEGCYNFLTGAGGFIQSLIYGYGGLRIRDDGLHLNATLPEIATYIKFRGLRYKESQFSYSLN